MGNLTFNFELIGRTSQGANQQRVKKPDTAWSLQQVERLTIYW